MAVITYDKIKCESEIEILQLQELSVTMQGNQHARAFVTGRLSEEGIRSSCERTDAFVKISCFDETSRLFKPLFVGIVDRIRYKKIKESFLAELQLVSATIGLDRERKSRSFQNTSLTYQEIAEQVLKKAGRSDGICTTGERAIERPVIQYQETDWKFLCRLASHCNAAIYPDEKAELPRLWFGFPNEVMKIEAEGIDYTAGVCEEYLDSDLPSGMFLYYDIELDADYHIGTRVIFQGRIWWIERKYIELRQGILVFQYRLRIRLSICEKKKYQPLFAGMSILGTVLSTDGETLKLHLDMDEQQEEEEAYSYEWTPDTGSVMYCMPEVGTKVSLYFPGEDEQMARAVSCVRENGACCPQMAESSRRGLRTQHGKELCLNPEDMGFKSEINQMKLADQQGVSLASMKKVSVTSGKSIKLKGKNVSFATPKEIQMARK